MKLAMEFAAYPPTAAPKEKTNYNKTHIENLIF